MQPARVEDVLAKALLRVVVDEAAEVDGGVYLVLLVPVHTRHGAMVGVVAKSAPEVDWRHEQCTHGRSRTASHAPGRRTCPKVVGGSVPPGIDVGHGHISSPFS